MNLIQKHLYPAWLFAMFRKEFVVKTKTSLKKSDKYVKIFVTILVIMGGLLLVSVNLICDAIQNMSLQEKSVR